MTNPQDGYQDKLSSESALVLPKTRPPAVSQTSRTSLAHALDDAPSPIKSTFPSSIASGSISSLGAGGDGGSLHPRPLTLDRTASPLAGAVQRPGDAKSIIIRSFAPRVAVLVSADVDAIMQEKGLSGGLLQLLRPFGDRVMGKVTIRDSAGASKSLEDYGVRFVSMESIQSTAAAPHIRASLSGPTSGNGHLEASKALPVTTSRRNGELSGIEDVVARHITHAEMQSGRSHVGDLRDDIPPADAGRSTSPFFSLFLRRLFSSTPVSSHETFCHPVACVIAISSHTASPIEELRRLYANTNSGSDTLPPWMSNDFLRYYVLVHDEDQDDITKSTLLFDQMKRHFGLHCHLLRLRSTQAVSSDDDAYRLQASDWISATEALEQMNAEGNSYNSMLTHREMAEDEIEAAVDEDITAYIFDSDATAIRSLVRELVVQSIVPFMERLSATWNDQVAAKRRGLSGRFISLSKRFTPFSSSKTSSVLAGGQSSSSSNYDSLQGFYKADAPEAVMRKLADFAFMLRDYKLAYSTFDILRSDYNTDKAWKYYAGANEMAALSLLLLHHGQGPRIRVDTLDQLFEAASYSYLTRCTSPYYAIRTLISGVELLKLRGPAAAVDAARWARRIVEMKLVGPIGNALFTERVKACYLSVRGPANSKLGTRQRKSGFWALIECEAWLFADKTRQADRALVDACRFYNYTVDDDDDRGRDRDHDDDDDKDDAHEEGKPSLLFDGMREHLYELQMTVATARAVSQGFEAAAESGADEASVVEEISEQLDRRPHRKSLVAPVSPFERFRPAVTTTGPDTLADPGFQARALQ